jgi:hypothetical protein
MFSSPPLQQRLRLPYQRDEWQKILHFIFPDGTVKLFASPHPLKASQDFVKGTRQLGTINLPDGNTIALLEVETSSQVKLARNRVGLRNFVSNFIDEAGASAVLAVFHQEKSDDWRLTYAARQTIIDEDTFEINTVETAPRRFTFLLGQGEPCRTAAARLAGVLERGNNLTLLDVEKAFSVEALSKEFFAKYNEHYDKFLAELTRPERISDTRARFCIPHCDSEEAQIKEEKPIRDYAKKLLGRLIFLHFLQKKGWMHFTAESADWSSGHRDFLNQYYLLAESYGHADNFHSLYLAPLFFEALNTERKDHLFTLSLPGGKTFTARMPYLNGGLFDPEPEPLRMLDLPPQLFADLFAFFAEYNFTIDENDPEDHEVGIDPEMLGHIFENLLEDNKDKGAYYTPKVIVSYMCRQSLLRYLERHLGKNENLTRLCVLHDPGDLRDKNNWCAVNAKKIATLLENVKICDPAIGSGAFPIGMLNEIVHLRTLLNQELNDPAERAKLKKSIIQNSIYGVDLDSGAVDIARLRFWLALVVDEEEPSPLPNLDYKIMQGNSLLESFQGVDLSSLHEEGSKKPLKIPLGLNQSELDIFTDAQQEFREAQQEKKRELQEAMREYFTPITPERKAELRGVIDKKVIDHIRHYFEVSIEEGEIVHKQTEVDWKEKRRRAPNWNPPSAAIKRHEKLAARIASLTDSLTKLNALQHQAERPFFLWHLLFQDVFENGGFDIVIANPPYVRHELIKEQKPLLEAEGYETYTGTSDLFVYFYERAIQLLKPNGVLTFITSNKFYRAGYGEQLRVHLSENLTLHTLIDFRDAPVFNGVIAYASILIGQKEKAPANHQVAALPWDQQKPAAALPVEIAKAFPVAQSSLTPDGWRLVSPAIEVLLAKLRQTGTPLGEYVQDRFYRGVLTGFNEAFVIDGKKRAELIAADPQSDEIIKPFLRGRDVKRWQATHADLWLLFIPWHFPLHNDPSISGPSLDAEKAFETQYPAVYSHLCSFKAQLSTRNSDETGIRYEWYALQRCAASYWQEFEQTKILYQEIATFQAFALDTSGAFSNNKTYLIPCAEPFLLPLLNSKIIWWFLGQVATKMVGGAFAMQSPYVSQIPIPPATAEEKSSLATLAEQCAAATAVGDNESLAAREHQINQLVYRLFHLTPAEIAMIEEATNASPAVGAPASNQGEVYPPALKGHVWNSLKRLAKKHAYVSLNAVKSDLAKTSSEKPGDKTLLKALSEAMAEGIVLDAGRGWYSGIPTPASLDPSHIRELEDLLAKRFPFLPHYLWSTLQLNPWMHHLSGKGIQFLHMDAEGEQDAADFLRSAGWDVLVNPTSKTAARLVPGPKCLVLRTVRREIDSDGPPTVATVLVDALLENGRLHFMDEVERKEMTRRLMQEKRIDFAALHSRLKNHKKTIEDLIGTGKSGIISEF